MAQTKTLILQKLLQVLDANLDKPDFSLDEVCKELGVSCTQSYQEMSFGRCQYVCQQIRRKQQV
ncbi:MAG: hypothetical protein ACK4GN_13875 [Runella sp.]